MLAPGVDAWLKNDRKCDPYTPSNLDNNVFKIETSNPAAPGKNLVLKQICLGDISTKDYQKNVNAASEEYKMMVDLKAIPEVVKEYGKFRFKDTIKNAEFFYILMEYTGDDLMAYLRKYPETTIEEKLDFMQKAAIGLKKIQDKTKSTIADIKPANLTILGKNVKFIDFGISIMVGGTTTFSVNTKVGEIKGFTKEYAPPEILGKDNPYKLNKIDVYCFGKTFFQFFYGKTTGQMEEILNSYATKQPGVDYFELNEWKHNNFYLNPLASSIIPGDTPDKNYSEAINMLLQKCGVWKYDDRPDFDQVIKMIESIKKGPRKPKEVKKMVNPPIIPEEKKEVYQDSEYSAEKGIYFLNAKTRKLYYIGKELATCQSFNEKAKDSVKCWDAKIPNDFKRISTITAPRNVIFLVGGQKGKKEGLPYIFEYDANDQTCRQLGVQLQTPRYATSLVADSSSIYILGGFSEPDIPIDTCEECQYSTGRNKEKIMQLPSLSEKKAKLSSCIFAKAFIYAFGGELNFSIERGDTDLVHTMSKRIERLNLNAKKAWETVEIANNPDCDWCGCTMSGAFQYADTIIIVGGLIKSKKNNDYDWAVAKIVYTPKTSSFGAIETVEDIRVDNFLNKCYCIQDRTILCCCKKLLNEKSQGIYAFNGQLPKWNLHYM